MYTLLLLIPLSIGGVFFLRQACRLVGPGHAAGCGLNRSKRLFYITVNLAIGLWFILCPVLAFVLYTFR